MPGKADDHEREWELEYQRRISAKAMDREGRPRSDILAFTLPGDPVKHKVELLADGQAEEAEQEALAHPGNGADHDAGRLGPEELDGDLAALLVDAEPATGAKALGALAVVALVQVPLLGALVYLIAYHDGIAERNQKGQEAAQAAFDQQVREAAGKSGPASEIETAQKLLDAGTITQEDFDKIKAKALDH